MEPASLDMLVTMNTSSTLKTRFYSKQAYKDQTINFQINHSSNHKFSCNQTLLKEAEIIATQKDQEKKKKALFITFEENRYLRNIVRKMVHTANNETKTRERQNKKIILPCAEM